MNKATALSVLALKLPEQQNMVVVAEKKVR
jgi:hypothetical protein